MSNITLPRAVAEESARFIDSPNTRLWPAGTQYRLWKAFRTALDAALAEPSLKVRVDSTAFTASAFSQTAVLEQAEAFETAYQTKRAALDPAFAELPAKPEPATREQAGAAYDGKKGTHRWVDFRDGWQAAERFHGIKKEDKT